MPQVRNTRDALKLKLDQSNTHLDTIKAYLTEVGLTILEGIPSDERMAQLLTMGYEPEYKTRMEQRVMLVDSILEGLEEIQKSVVSLNKSL
jgi:hypothetical protein